MKRINLLLTAILLVAFTTPAFSYEGWVDYTNEYHINTLTSHGDLVWCGTKTGVFSFDINTEEEVRYRETDGLVDNDINDITADADGMIWCATDAGVSSFDGETWASYPSSVYFDGAKVRTVEIDRDDVVWFGTDRGVVSYDGETWRMHETENLTGIVSSAVDSTNVKWFGTEEQGLFRFDGEMWEQKTEFPIDNTSNTFVLLNSCVSCVYINNDNHLWICTSNQYVVLFDGLTCTVDPNRIQGTIKFFESKDNKKFYSVTEFDVNSGIIVYSNHYDTFGDQNAYYNHKNTFLISDFHEHNEAIWLGTERGFWKHSNTETEQCTKEKAWPPDRILDICIDVDDTILLSSLEHVYTIKDNAVSVDVDIKSPVGNIEFGYNDYVYFSPYLNSHTACDLYVMKNNESTLIYHQSDLGSTSITNTEMNGNDLIVCFNAIDHGYYPGMGVVRDGILYPSKYRMRHIVSHNNYLWGTSIEPADNGSDYFSKIVKCQYQISSHSLEITNHTLIDSTLTSDGFYDYIAVDESDLIWVYLRDNGLMSYDGTTKTYYNVDNSPLPSNTIHCLAVDKANAKWFGTDKGLACFDDENWEVFTTENSGLIDDDVTAIAFTADNTAWIGTASGVCVYTGDQVVSVEDDFGAEVTPETRPLVQVHPNPFNPTTTIRYELAKPAQVKLAVYSIAGQKVAALVDAPMTAGRHEAVFDGAELASGVYVYRLDADGVVTSGKMLMVR